MRSLIIKSKKTTTLRLWKCQRSEILLYIRKILSSSLFKSSFIYTIANIINMAIPFFMLPILTRYLTPKDYGIVTILSLLLSFTTPFLGLCVNGAIQRQFYHLKKEEMSIYITNCLFILMGSSLLTTGVFWVFGNEICRWTSFPIDWLWAVIVIGFTQFISTILLSIWQVQEMSLSYSAFQISQAIVNTVLSVWFVVGLSMNWQGRIYGQVISSVLFFVVAIILLFKNGWIKLEKNNGYIKDALAFGVPLVPHLLSGTIKGVIDRIFIANMINLTVAGLYSVGFQMASFIIVLATSFNNAYVPWLYEKLKANEISTKKKIVIFTYIYFIVALLLVVIFSLAARFLFPIFLGDKFADSVIYVWWISIGFAFNGMYFMVVNYIFYANKTRVLGIITLLTSFLSVILNYFSIKTWGALGAAYTFALVNFITFIAVWIYSNKVLPMPWNIFKKRLSSKSLI